MQRFRRICTVTQIKKPYSRFLFYLFEILSAISSKNEWDFIAVPIIDNILVMLRFYHTGVILALIIDNRWDIYTYFLCFNNSDKFKSYKQSIVCIAAPSYRRISWKFSNSNITSFLRSCSFGISEIVCINFPTIFSKLVVNNNACFGFGKLHCLCNFCRFVGSVLCRRTLRSCYNRFSFSSVCELFL